MEKYLECAKICSTHGVKGSVKLENRCDNPTVLARLKKMYKKNSNGDFLPLMVVGSFVQKNMVVVTFSGVDTVEAAAVMKDMILYADRDDIKLKKGEYFIADLIGLPVFDDESGAEIGRLTEVIQPGAQQIYVIKKENGQSFMVPVVKEFIKDISLENGIKIKIIEGLCDT